MRLFDRNAKLRSRLRGGRLVDEPKQMLPLLKGRLGKDDLPTFIVEPASLDELRATIEFAVERHLKVAVGGGLKPVSVRALSGQLLILTSRLVGSPIISANHGTARVAAGFPAESLAIDLSRAGLEWWPLWPVPHGKSVAAMIARGWEGVRNLRRGGTMSHVRQIEWMGYDGRSYSTGFTSPEISGFHFGARATLGIITSLVLEVSPALRSRSAVILEFVSAEEAAQCIGELVVCQPEPETVLYWGKAATDIIRAGNDGTITENGGCAVLAEWGEENIQLSAPWDECAKYYSDETAVRALWQDVLRLPRTTTRLFPSGRMEARMRMPLDAIPIVEDAAADLARDANLTIGIWGTPELGYVYLWVMLPDDELTTRTRARENLNRLIEIAVGLGARRAAGDGPWSRAHAFTSEGKYADRLRTTLTERCDPESMHLALCAD